MRVLSGHHWLAFVVVLYAAIVFLVDIQAIEVRRDTAHTKNNGQKYHHHHHHHRALTKRNHANAAGRSGKKGDKHRLYHHKQTSHKTKSNKHLYKHDHEYSEKRKELKADQADVRCAVPGFGQCPTDRPCCSKWGWCGNSVDHCGQGCQPLFGICTEGGEGTAQKKRVYRGKGRLHHWSDRFIVNQRVKGPKLPPNPLWISHKGIPKVPTSTSGDGNRLISVGYFAGWTQYRGIGNKTCQQRPYLPSSIPWSSLDYVMFAFAYFDDAAELYPADPADEKLYFQINQLKVGTNTRVLLSVGGWSFINPLHTDIEDTRLRFENMVQTPEMRRQFIDSCITFCEFYGFDGIDIDWEYPSVHLRPMVTQLFQEMRRAFDNHGHGLILTVAGGPFRDAVRGFDFDKIANDVDFFMIMAYDMYGAYDPSGIVNIHTSLLQMPTEHQQGHSVQGAVELYVDLGVPRDKIVLGIALYGKTYTLANHKQITPGIAQFQSPGAPTNCMESPGDIAYNEIAALLNHRHKPQWDSDAHAFYFVYGQRQDTWVGYDDRPSIDLKLQLITENELAGFMWWSLDQDLDRTSAWAGAPMANRDNKTQQAAPSRDAGHQLQNCPSLAKPPENFASIPANQLGQPGLVVYAAQKRTHCPAYVEPTVVLPPTPLGNTVFVKCPFIPGCPVFNDAYQAYTCTPQGWSQPSQCYAKSSLAPTSYFFGELQLVRATVRDRNEPGADGFLDGFPAYIRNHHHRPPPPKSVESILHENSDLQWTKDILRLQRKLRDDTKKKKNERKEF